MSSAARGSRSDIGPFEEHLRDAIALNRDRAPRYDALSDGASRPISRALIGAERVLLPLARWFDRRAEPYERAGVPLLSSLFVPMSTAPPFLPVRSPGLGELDRFSPPTSAMRRRVASAYRAGAFPGAAQALASEIAALADAPSVNCLVRHLLESAYRLSQLAPIHVAAATERGLRSPAPLLARLLRLHLLALGSAAVLDRRARPLQARGIAILAQDLPPIQQVVPSGARNPWPPGRASNDSSLRSE